jgi:glycosyltransferase involved in cell wall biosynthesis
MRILHLLYESKGDPFGIGGVGVRAYEVYKCIKERHDVTLLCKKYQGANDGEIEGLRHIFVGTESKSLTKTLLSYAYHASRFVNRHSHEYDIIIEEFSPAIPFFPPAFIRKPVVLQVQGYTGKFYFRKYNPFYALTLFLMELLRPRFYDNFIFVNSETMKTFSLKNTKRIAIISNGISSELLNIPSDEKDYILYLGRIDIYGKGLDILLDAYREFIKSFPHVRLVIAGDGRDSERFDAMLMKLPEDMRNNIEMPGWVSGDKKRDVLNKALFVVLPSRHECQPIVALEAMGSGKAVIVSEIPEFNFITEHQALVSFKPGNAASLAQSMKNLVSNTERKEMGQRGRNWVKDFTWDKIALKYEEFLCKVLEK